MSRPRKPGPIAEPAEVLIFWSDVLRGKVGDEPVRKPAGEERGGTAKLSERFKGAEMLGKYYGLFDRKEETPARGAIADQVLRELEQMHARIQQGGA